MEAVEKPLQNPTIDDVKVNTKCEESADAAVEKDVGHKSNGVAESVNARDNSDTAKTDTGTTQDVDTVSDQINPVNEKIEAENEPERPHASPATEVPHVPVALEIEVTTPTAEVTVEPAVVEYEPRLADPFKTIQEPTELLADDTEKVMIHDETHVEESTVEVDGIIDPSNDRVTFETEILVETHENDFSENMPDEVKVEHETTNNILSELGNSIELSEALRSSDVTDNIENNNCTVRQEVFNKEELLDILEGNDAEESEANNKVAKIGQTDKVLETQLALQQLSRLQSKSRKMRAERTHKRRKSDKKIIINKKEPEMKKDESIVNALVKDWEEEPLEGEQVLLQESDSLLNKCEGLVKVVSIEEVVTTQEQTLIRTSVDSTTSDGQSPIPTKSGDESLPQRRLGRIIKKKVIFDPDNPDTFTKGKSSSKNKEIPIDKDHPPLKKSKGDLSRQRSKSKSPMSKMQWKKPPPKNSKQCKRLTEIDRLLMDEGAVNMIYQLTPEAPKGKKNMKTKAEFIKKIQSSTPDTKEMKFRERKKDYKCEEGDAKKILGGKQRPSLNSSVKSPSVCEDFEAHSADDSIIYRRHSSSSYSSSCMSPRRLSDVEAGANQGVTRVSLLETDIQNRSNIEPDNNGSVHDTFMGDDTNAPNEVINKDDCLSIKEKLNSKLSLALNKRKRESTKNEKPSKQKKLKNDEKSVAKHDDATDFKYLSISIDQRLCEICIHSSGSKYTTEVMKELEIALLYVDSKEDVSVTLLTSECGTLCSGLDLKPLLVDNIETRTNCAYEIAESARSLLSAVERHSKMLCTGVGANCSGLGLALVALSDVTLASERASFALVTDDAAASPLNVALLVPGVAALSANNRSLSQSLLNDLVVFWRRLSASEALRRGLVSRVLWPDGFLVHLRNIAKDIAAQPAQNLLLKKQLLSLKKSGSGNLLATCLEKERDMLVKYWTSDEGLAMIRGTFEAA